MSVGIHTSAGLKITGGSAVGTNPFSVGNAGLVPAPKPEDANKVLRGDGTWVNSASGTMLTDTLLAGRTEIIFNSDLITESSCLTFFTSKFGFGPKNANAYNGTVVLTFDAQDEDVDIGVKIE